MDDLRAAQEGYDAAEAINWDNTNLLARLHLRLNEPGAAQAVLDKVLEAARRDRSDDARFWTLYAQVLFQGKQLDRALAMVNQILQGAPGNADAKALQFAIYEKQGRKEEALRVAEAITDDPATVRLIEARGLLLESDHAGALAAVKRGLIDAPAHEKLVSAAVRILLKLDRAEEARDIVEAALRVRPDDTRLQLHLALTRDDLSPAERDAAILKYIDQEEDAYQRTLELIGFYLGKGDPVRLLELLDEAIGYLTSAGTPSAQRAASSQLRILLETKVSVASSLGDTEAMFRVRDLATELNVDGADGKSFEGLVFMHLEDYEAAIDSLREASAAQPTDGRLLARLGQCYQILDRQDEAEAFYHRALQVNSEQKSAHKGLAMLAKGRGDEVAYEHHFRIAEPLLADDPWIRAQRLQREEKTNPSAAISRRKEERLEDPQDVENLIRLAGLYETVGDADHASEVYTTALASAPSHKALVASAAGFYRRSDQAESAVDAITRYIQSQSEADEKARGYLLLASHFLHLDTLDRAEAALRSALQASESLEVIETLAEFYLRSAKRPDQAMHWADKAVAIARSTQSARLPRILAMRVTCQLQPELDDIDKAQRYCDELLMDHPDYQPALLLLSEIKSRQGDIGAAIRTISDYLSRFPDDPKALYQRALHHLARGRSGSAIEDLEHLKRSAPLALDLRPRLLLAGLQRNAGRPDQGIRELETLLDDAPESTPVLESLVRAYIEQGRYADAVRRVTARINSEGDNPGARWLFLRAQAAAQLDNFSAALSDAKRGAAIDGHDPLGMKLVLDVYLRAGWASEGAAYFQKYATAQPVTAALASQYARVLLAAGRHAEAVDQFRIAMAAAIDQTADVVRVVSADLNAAFQGSDAARNALELFEQSAPTGALGRANDRIRVRLYRLASDTSAATNVLIKLVDSTKNKSERALLYLELGDLYQGGDRASDARGAYEEALKYHPDHWITLNNLAFVVSEGLAQPELALEFAERAVAAMDTPDTRDTLGWIQVKLGNMIEALRSLSETVRRGSGDPWHYYHLGEAYRRDGQYGEASGILQTGRQM
ncbi:MAG: tetratricopeptide repeat protein, partial [Planctomycetes bacterium]|nr:tetratricopeptide repeat protein [Planctomycetota bacterium]